MFYNNHLDRVQRAAQYCLRLAVAAIYAMARLAAKWSPRFIGWYQREPAGWYGYRYVPSLGKKRFVAPWEPVAIATGMVVMLLLLQSGSFGWPLLACVCVVTSLVVAVAKRSQRVCAKSVEARQWAWEKLKDFWRAAKARGVILRAAIIRQAPIVWRAVKVWVKYALKQMWLFSWYFIGFRWREGGWPYGYRRNPNRIERRDYSTPLELIVMMVSIVMAATSVETSLLAWEVMTAPIVRVYLLSLPAAVVVLLIGHRQYAHLKAKRDKERQLHQDELKAKLMLRKARHSVDDVPQSEI